MVDNMQDGSGNGLDDGDGLGEPDAQDAARLARHRRLAEADHRHLWHPFTQMQGWLEDDPLIIDAAEGVHLVDTLGRRYLDGVSSLWCNVHGHRVPEIDAAVRAQLDRVAHTTLLGLASTASIECAEELARVAPPGLTRVFFSDAGATAVEVAVKLAYQHHQLRGDVERREFVALAGGYHGDTLGAVSVGGIDLFHRLFQPLLFPVHRAPQPHCYRCPLGLAPERCGAGLRRRGGAHLRRAARARRRPGGGAAGAGRRRHDHAAAGATCDVCGSCATARAPCSSATRWPPASAAPAPCSRWSRRASSPT